MDTQKPPSRLQRSATFGVRPFNSTQRTIPCIQHSSPRSDASKLGHTGFLVNDSIASSIVSSSIHNRHSLSESDLPSSTAIHQPCLPVRNDVTPPSADADKVAWCSLLNSFTEMFRLRKIDKEIELDRLFTEVGEKRAQLHATRCAIARWIEWLSAMKSLQSENQILDSIIATLEQPIVISAHDEPEKQGSTNLIDRVKEFNESHIAPVLNSLPLRGFSDQDIIGIGNCSDFVHASDKEIQALDKLASALDVVKTRLLDDTKPLLNDREEQLSNATDLLAHEASLRLECLQSQWLKDDLLI